MFDDLEPGRFEDTKGIVRPEKCLGLLRNGPLVRVTQQAPVCWIVISSKEING